MKALQLRLPENEDPTYIRIAAAVVAAIEDGRLEPAATLPSTRAIALSLSVHRQTVMAGLSELVAQGWLTSRPRSGYRVNTTLPARNRTQRNRRMVAVTRAKISPVFRDTDFESDPDPTQFAYAFRAESPDLRVFPNVEFRRIISRCLNRDDEQILDYGPPQGAPELVDALGHYVRRLRSIAGKQLIVTSGAQEGIYLTSRLLLNEKSSVAVEPLGYPPAWRAFRATGAKLVPLQADEDGVIPESLERAANRHNVRLVYLMPLHQFPTTVTLSIERRMAIYDIASKHGVAILEDDYDHEFHYSCRPLAPMASADPAQLVFYVFSLSKLAFPSIRIGALVVPEHLADNVLAYRQFALGNPAQIIQRATAEWMIGGGFERHMWKMDRLYKKRRDVLVRALAGLQRKDKNLFFRVPDGGMAIWVNMKTDTDRLAHRAREKGVLLQKESSYRLKPGPSTHIRLGFANQDTQCLLSGMRVLETLI